MCWCAVKKLLTHSPPWHIKTHLVASLIRKVLNIHKVVQQCVQGVVGSLMLTSLQIYCESDDKRILKMVGLWWNYGRVKWWIFHRLVTRYTLCKATSSMLRPWRVLLSLNEVSLVNASACWPIVADRLLRSIATTNPKPDPTLIVTVNAKFSHFCTNKLPLL